MEPETPERRWRIAEPKMLLLFVAATLAASLFGSLSTVNAADQYRDLVQPSWAPPSWLFGPVWTTLYVLIAIAGYRIWRAFGRSIEVTLWGVQMFMNALWSPLFFAMGWRGPALSWIIILDFVVAYLIYRTAQRDKPAAAMLAPYLAWIGFASALNAAVFVLN